ncbi:hypothetical protein NLU13_1281 [Sarocladium strictum]|uniref:Uncharacterized protein n=1 Tax=Sarocladium strictum TaxID=5046 RepID=A0AA39GTG4_SARSR|nr:hypothetical protein NLU13_1281 [Sarocladium strictum]
MPSLTYLFLFGLIEAATCKVIQLPHNDAHDPSKSLVISAQLAPLSALPGTVDDVCGPGQLCDCDRILDKNSDAYFRCVTNWACEHCWVSPWPPIQPKTRTPVATVTATNLTTSGNRNSTPTRIPSTVVPTPESSLTPSFTTTTPAVPEPTRTCPPECDCSWIEDKDSWDALRIRIVKDVHSRLDASSRSDDMDELSDPWMELLLFA